MFLIVYIAYCSKVIHPSNSKILTVKDSTKYSITVKKEKLALLCLAAKASLPE